MRTSERFIATRLEEVLDGQGRQRTWLASRLGVDPSYVTLIVKGRRTIKRETAERVAELLNLPISVIFDRTDRTANSTKRHTTRSTAA